MEYVWNIYSDIYGEIYDMMTGWWLSHPSEKYKFVNWDDGSQHMEK